MVKKYGLPMLVTSDEGLKEYIQTILAQVSGELDTRSPQQRPQLIILSLLLSPLTRQTLVATTSLSRPRPIQPSHLTSPRLALSRTARPTPLRFARSTLADWLLSSTLTRLVLAIKSVETDETLERWQFDIHTEDGPTTAGAMPGAPKPTRRHNKTEKEVQGEIREIMKQITSSVTFLPILDDECEWGVTPRKQRCDKTARHVWPSGVSSPMRGGSTLPSCVIPPYQLRGSLARAGVVLVFAKPRP